MKRGDHVWIERDGQKVRAMVTLASPNGDSLMVMFDALFHGYAGMMPLLRENGEYCDLVEGKPVKVERIEP
jgi:uncharacterized membrane protein